PGGPSGGVAPLGPEKEDGCGCAQNPRVALGGRAPRVSHPATELHLLPVWLQQTSRPPLPPSSQTPHARELLRAPGRHARMPSVRRALPRAPLRALPRDAPHERIRRRSVPPALPLPPLRAPHARRVLLPPGDGRALRARQSGAPHVALPLRPHRTRRRPPRCRLPRALAPLRAWLPPGEPKGKRLLHHSVQLLRASPRAFLLLRA